MLRRALPKKTAKGIQDAVNNIKNKPLLRRINLRWSIGISCICLVIVVILYQFDYFSNKDAVHVSNHSTIGSFLNPYASNRPIKQQPLRSDTMHANQMMEVAPKSQISPEIFDKLQMRKTPISKLHSPVWPMAEIGPLLMPYTKQSWTEQCESSTFLPYNFYNYMIKPDEIEYIFPSNDKDLYNLINSEDFTFHWDVSFLGDDFWDFVEQLQTDSESGSVDVATLKEIYQSQRNLLGSKKSNQASLNRLFDWNGLTADLALYMRQAHSVGADRTHWLVTDTCVEHKSCDVYPIHRVLHRSKQISCHDILTKLLPPIFECVSKHGRKCPNVIDSGYYRIIMKAEYAPTGEPVVIKMMKPKSIKKERDLIRHIREAILLGYLYDLEQQYLTQYGDGGAEDETGENEEKTRRLFTQSLNGDTKQRAFNYVEEYGHCVTPLWISVSPLYKMPLDKWIASGKALKSTLQKLIFMTMQIAYSVELIHNIPGGPFHHTDIQPRQFLLDENDNVYINDFNRGKFQPYYFGDEFDAMMSNDDNDNDAAAGDRNSDIQKCWYCGHRSRGHWRAPEEPRRYPLNEKLDIFSMGLTMWAMFSSDIPFKNAKFEDLTFLYFESRRIPPMPANMPPAIKDVVRACLSWNPRQRPSATQVVQSLEEIYHSSLEVVTEGMQKRLSKDLLSEDFWSETNDPPPQPRDKKNE